jgi:inorganic pyrophosphatase
VNIDKISIGEDAPRDVNVLIEIPQGGVPVKYELDKESGVLRVDRFLHTAMYYPGNYGFVPHTLSGDGDPVDVMVVGQVPVVPGAIIRCRPVGALLMKDEAGPDEKIIAVPVDKLHPFYTGVKSYQDLPVILTEQIAHFFQHYKDLEKGKWVTIVNWVGPEKAERMIIDGIRRAAQAGDDVAAHHIAAGAMQKRAPRAKAKPKAAPAAQSKPKAPRKAPSKATRKATKAAD